MTRLILIIALGLLAACAPRATLVTVPGLDPSLETRSVFVATTRAAANGQFGAARTGRPAFLRYDMTVPPLREKGGSPFLATKPDPQTQFLVRSRTDFQTSASFQSALSNALNQRNRAQREAIIFVHGFNNTFDEGVLRITQLAEDFDFDGVSVHYSWPSAGSPLGYAYDRDSLLIARDGLDGLISQVEAAGAQRVIIVAHSVGSMLVMETLRQRAIARPGSVAQDIDGVILISPDIDVQLFRTQALRIGKLPQPFGIFVSRRDRVLGLSARLTGQSNRLGNLRDGSAVAGLDVALVDVTDLSTGAGHFTAASSPAIISLFGQAGSLNAAFKGDRAGRTGLIPGTVITVRTATDIILSPITGLAQ